LTRLSIAGVAAVAIAMTLGVSLIAKGKATRIVVTGPGLRQPLALTDADVLAVNV
jgi:hypothetical protein